MDDSPPLVSVIIPVFNDPNGIDTTLASLVEQTYPKYELIPVDNHSTDATPTVIREWKNQYPDLIFPTEERNVQSSYAARNTGIDQASGSILVFIDADMTTPKYWIKQVASTFQRTAADYLGYETEIVIPDGEEGLWGWYDKMMGLPSRYHYEEKQFVPTSCLAVRSTVFDTVGRFNEQLISSGDREFGERVHAHPELQTVFSDDIVVYHPARTTFRAHYKKALRIGRGLVQVHLTNQSDRLDTSFTDLLDHVWPPNPLRIYRQTRSLTLSQYSLLYLMDWVIRYLRLYGALTEYVHSVSAPADNIALPSTSFPVPFAR